MLEISSAAYDLLTGEWISEQKERILGAFRVNLPNNLSNVYIAPLSTAHDHTDDVSEASSGDGRRGSEIEKDKVMWKKIAARN